MEYPDIQLSLTDCQYQYLQQPPGNLSCNPFGSRLQLSCIASGPLDQQFQITWYSSTINNTQEITTLSPDLGYTIQQHVLNNSVDNQKTITSILIKDEIGDNDTDRCVWCRIEIDGRPLPVRSNRPCILDDTGLLNCSVSPPPTNSTPVCADPSGGVAPTGLAIQPQSATLFSLPTLSQTASSSVYSTANINIINTPLIETTNTNTPTLSQEYLHTELPPSSPRMETTARFTVSGTPLNVPMNSNDSNGTRQEALIATVTVCVVFIIIILVLVGIIVFQMRRKVQGIRKSPGKKEPKETQISGKYVCTHKPDT